MIYLKNNTETQAIYIPRQTVLGSGYIATTEKYEEAYNNGLEDGKEQQKSKLESINITENGQYEREDGWNVVTVDVHTEGGDAYNTIADIYGSPSDSTVTFKGLVALSFKYGNGKNILFTDHTGSIILKNCQVPLNVGDECLVTATLRRNNTTYISSLSKPSIEVLSSNNYVVMPADAVELTNLDNLYIPNEGGYAEMKYLYADGTVVRAPIAPDYDFMRIETRQGNIGLRGNFSNWETKLVEGDNIRVYMFTENSQNVFFVTDIIKLGVEGGEGSSCNLGILDLTLKSPNPIQKNASDDGYDGYSAVVVRPENIIAQEKENAINDFKNKMDEITITQNGTYSIDTQETKQYIEFDGNSYFDTNIPFGENTKIEVAILRTNYKKRQIIGCAQFDLIKEAENYGGFGIVLGADFVYGVYGKAKTNNIPFAVDEEQILTLDRNGIHSSYGNRTGGWIDDSGLGDSSVYGTTIGIGRINSVANGWANIGLNGRIRYVKIWANKDDDSTLITYTPKTNGNFDANGVELQRLGDGTTTYVEENVKKYPYGFKRVEVNVPQGSCNLEDKSVTPSMADRDGNNLIVVEESEGYDGLSRVVIDPQTLYNEGVEAGRAEGGSCNLINPIVFSEEAGNTINAENVQIPTFVYEGNQYYNVGSFNLADIEEFKIHILFKPNNRGDAEPVNIFGCEDTDWDNTTFGVRIYEGNITFRMSGQEVVSPYTENAWYDVEMGYNATKRWVIVNGKTLLETEHTSFNRPRQTLMIGAINSGGNAFRPFYGKIAAIYIESNGNQVYLLPKEDGAMYVYWNNRTNRRNSISGENNARFENDYISGDGMKSITWLGNLEDKWVTPSMNDRDSNGYIVVSPSEGYNGLKRTVINPQTLYNEGYNKGLVDATPSTIGGIKFGNSTFEECTFNLEGIEDFSYLFENCRNLRTAPSIQKPIKSARNMFRGCSSLTTAPTYNTSEATDLGSMYAGCHNLTSVGAVNCSSLPNAPIGSNKEASIFDTNQYPSLTDFGGFINLKLSVDLSGLIALSVNSVENIFNNLYDFSGNGETPNAIQGNIIMSSIITDAVEQYRTIAESKGWTITIK